MIAGTFNFKDAQLFEVEDEASREVPEVDF